LVRELDLELELLAVFHHPGHDQPIDTDETTNVILHPLFLLVRVFDNAKPARSSGCLLSEPQPRSISKTPNLNRRRGVSLSPAPTSLLPFAERLEEASF
jgi:hypothetical protein